MIHIIHQLRKASGTNAKKAVLKKYEDVPFWKQYLLAVYNPYVNYYIGSTTDTTFLSADEYEDVDFQKMFDDLTYLTGRTFTGNLAKEYAVELSEKYGELFRLILKGNINAGINVKTINNVYGDLIPTFPVMLGTDKADAEYPVLMSVKYDGVRVLAFVTENGVTLRTRSGKQLNVKSLEISMAHLPHGVYDGELVKGDGKMVGRTRITGDVNKCLRGTATDIKDYTFMVFDYIQQIQWDTKRCTEMYLERLDALEHAVNVYKPVNMKVVDQVYVQNRTAVDTAFEDLVSRGFEGVMLRYGHDMYVWDRSPALIKRKAVNECTLEVVDVQEGKEGSKYEGMVGALICQGVVEGKVVHVKVGSGLSDFDRDQRPEYYIGNNIEAMYNSVVKAENSNVYSLFLPRFKRVLGGTV